MREKIERILFWLTIVVSALSVLFIVTTYFGWYIPSSSISIFLGIVALSIYLNFVLQKSSNKKREILLLFVLSLYVNILISGTIYSIWSSEQIFTKQGITKMSIFVIFILSVALITSYIRAKVNYKQVRGNQRHSEAWRISNKELKDMKESKDIYINLGLYHEKEID